MALLAGVGAGLFTFVRGFFAYRQYRVVADTPAACIRGAPMGLVHIRGQVRGGETLLSPLTHTPCCVFKVIVEEWHTDLRGEGNWKQAAVDIVGVKFNLADDSGSVVVDPTGAELDLPQRATREVDGHATGGACGPSAAPEGPERRATFPATDTELLEYVVQARSRRPIWTAGDDRRARVMRLILDRHDPGGDIQRTALEVWKQAEGSAEFQRTLDQFAEAYARALAATKGSVPPPVGSANHRELMMLMAALAAAVADPSVDERDEKARQAAAVYARERLAERGSRPTSTPTGMFRLTEFCLLPNEWYDITGTCAENPSPRDESDRNIILKGLNEPTFLISSKASRDVQLWLRRRSLGMIFGGAALAIACLAFFLGRVGLLRP